MKQASTSVGEKFTFLRRSSINASQHPIKEYEYIHVIYLKLLRFCFWYLKLQFICLLTYETLPFWKSKQIEKQIVKSHDTQKYCLTFLPAPVILLPLSVSKDFLTSESIISVNKLTFKKMKRCFLKLPKYFLLKIIYGMNLPLKINLRYACMLFHLKKSWNEHCCFVLNQYWGGLPFILCIFYSIWVSREQKKVRSAGSSNLKITVERSQCSQFQLPFQGQWA